MSDAWPTNTPSSAPRSAQSQRSSRALHARSTVTCTVAGLVGPTLTLAAFQLARPAAARGAQGGAARGGARWVSFATPAATRVQLAADDDSLWCVRQRGRQTDADGLYTIKDLQGAPLHLLHPVHLLQRGQTVQRRQSALVVVRAGSAQ